MSANIPPALTARHQGTLLAGLKGAGSHESPAGRWDPAPEHPGPPGLQHSGSRRVCGSRANCLRRLNIMEVSLSDPRCEVGQHPWSRGSLEIGTEAGLPAPSPVRPSRVFQPQATGSGRAVAPPTSSVTPSPSSLTLPSSQEPRGRGGSPVASNACSCQGLCRTRGGRSRHPSTLTAAQGACPHRTCQVLETGLRTPGSAARLRAFPQCATRPCRLPGHVT